MSDVISKTCQVVDFCDNFWRVCGGSPIKAIFTLMIRSFVKARDIKSFQHDREFHQQLSRRCVYADTSGLWVTIQEMYNIHIFHKCVQFYNTKVYLIRNKMTQKDIKMDKLRFFSGEDDGLLFDAFIFKVSFPD